MKKRKQVLEMILYLVLLLMGFVFMLPLFVTWTNSFMEESEILLNYSSALSVFDLLDGITERFKRFVLIPARLSVSQYAEVLVKQPSFMALLFNSLKITVPVTVLSLFISILSAYGFTVSNWKYKEIVFMLYIIVMLMPLQAVIVPNYIIADILGIKKTYLAIILPGAFSPFGVFLARQGMKAVPKENFEAARIDGAGEAGVLFFIIAPQMRSTLAALSMLTFIEYWNIVEQAVIFIDDYAKEPLSIYLSRIAEGRLGLIFAASCVYMLPPMWLLLSGQEDLEKGIELSGIK
jgi:multiple sugar transport system permease protein